MKTIVKKFSLSLLVLVPTALAILRFMWELGGLGDWGRESGYYGQFNRVKHVLEGMPNVQVTNQWQHHDVTMEDFGFFLHVDNRDSVRVDFWEGSDQMKERDTRVLREFIEEEIRKARTMQSSVLRTRGTSPAGQEPRRSPQSAHC